ncbi:MAG: hypothetical protein L0332_00555 [Chloroflexi bacterium]|nr:hypothetical protein [Chloroflexota bacterium]MCI0577576.1 hypothetical protein [Chloroflexota bacterium]MCI0644204.1 hypothetical protein [Chloroflexota bacterium]MCI0725213.1 hypothetical protein [Chloroflexota bacterium]
MIRLYRLLAIGLAIILTACSPPAGSPGTLPVQRNDATPTPAGGDEQTGAVQPEVTPVGTVEDVVTAGSAVVYPEDPSQAGLAPYPDEPVQTLPTQPVSVTYVIEHRTALDGQEVVVRGIVVATLLGEKACPSDMGMCAPPSLFLSDSAAPDRNPYYDLHVVVAESEVEEEYPPGAEIEIRILVSGSNVAVTALKLY